MASDDGYTKALLHMDGADASTTFTDEGGKTWTANGNAQIDTAQSKFGGASGLFDGTGDWIDTPDSADFDVGSGDFTIDFWIRKNADGSNQAVCGQTDSSFTTTDTALLFQLLSDNTVRGGFYSTSTFYGTASTGTVTVDSTWHHIAYVRDGNTLRQFIDGTQDGTTDVTGVTVNNSTGKFSIGRPGDSASQYFNGWVDEFRFSKGIARWTANFTPPTRAYAPAGGIILFF